MTVYFEFKEYRGVYDEMTGFLKVTNAYYNDVYIKSYANKYTAKRGFENIVRYRRATEKEG